MRVITLHKKWTTYFVFIILILFQLTSCHFREKSSSIFIKDIPIKQETLNIEFDILENEDHKVRELKFPSHLDYKMLATLKRINISDTIIEVFKPMEHENRKFEINNLQGESVDSLIASYDYSINFNPETYESLDNVIKLKPKEFVVDTIDLTQDFNFFNLVEPAVFLIRNKQELPFKDIKYSNWETLIIK